MRCPNDDTELLETERLEIEIRYCPSCNGAWLDRSDLDELITRAASVEPDDDDLFEDDADLESDWSRRRGEREVWDDARPRSDKRNKSHRREFSRGAFEL